MDTQIIAMFCLCDDILKGLHHRDDPQSQMVKESGSRNNEDILDPDSQFE